MMLGRMHTNTSTMGTRMQFSHKKIEIAYGPTIHHSPLYTEKLLPTYTQKIIFSHRNYVMCKTMDVTGQQQVTQNKEDSEGSRSYGETFIMKAEGRPLVQKGGSGMDKKREEGMLGLYFGSDILQSKKYAYTNMPQ